MQKNAKLRASIAQLLGQVLMIGAVLHLYLLYIALRDTNYYLLTYLVVIQTYTIFFCKRSETFIRGMRWFRPYEIFQETDIVYEAKIQETKCLFGLHPHGIYTYSIFMNVAKPGTFLDNCVLMGSRIALMFPLGGTVLQWMGIEGVNPENLKKRMNQNRNIAFVPGGFEEATITTKAENRVYIKNRKGFIKYALQHGYTLYPVFNFGENQLFNTFDKWTEFRLFLNKWKIVGTFFWSRFGTYPEPNVKLITVVSQGIKLPTIANPTQDEIDVYHKMYVEDLVRLYNKYQPQYAPDQKLKLF